MLLLCSWCEQWILDHVAAAKKYLKGKPVIMSEYNIEPFEQSQEKMSRMVRFPDKRGGQGCLSRSLSGWLVLTRITCTCSNLEVAGRGKPAVNVPTPAFQMHWWQHSVTPRVGDSLCNNLGSLSTSSACVVLCTYAGVQSISARYQDRRTLGWCNDLVAVQP